MVRLIFVGLHTRENRNVPTIDSDTVLDREQLRAVTLDDAQLMRDIVWALVEDTSRQIGLLQTAIRDQDAHRCARLAQYSKGACTNLGANAAAAALRGIERGAASGRFRECEISLNTLSREVERLRVVAAQV